MQIVKTSIFILSILIFISCKKDNDNTTDLIAKHQAIGSYTAQITPAFMGTTPMASGEHIIHIDDLGNNRLRLHYSGFRVAPMPFKMTIDIIMNVTKGSNNTLIFDGKKGIFRADPPDGEDIDPEDIPEGLEFPEGSEGGLFSENASITGTYNEVEIDGKKSWRYDLKIIPGVPLPIEILIYTKNKL